MHSSRGTLTRALRTRDVLPNGPVEIQQLALNNRGQVILNVGVDDAAPAALYQLIVATPIQ
jgi:hypothetical protein